MATKFQLAVWKACSRIPKGKVATYAEIAKAIGKSKAVRAVGNALNKNPYVSDFKTRNSRHKTYSIPCHRVIKSNGSVGGYAHGTRKKIELLKNEGVEIKNGKVVRES
ncbi:MAG: MGMT family protein [Candidatus Micrarchaeota archaeon]|nr:MGMT family protein [Candidatus Micrarchaeota archaeon]